MLVKPFVMAWRLLTEALRKEIVDRESKFTALAVLREIRSNANDMISTIDKEIREELTTAPVNPDGKTTIAVGDVVVVKHPDADPSLIISDDLEKVERALNLVGLDAKTIESCFVTTRTVNTAVVKRLFEIGRIDKDNFKGLFEEVPGRAGSVTVKLSGEVSRIIGLDPIVLQEEIIAAEDGESVLSILSRRA